MRTTAFACLLLLTACASPRWANPTNPGADLQADLALCQKDAERLAKLSNLARPPGALEGCTPATACAGGEVQRTSEGLGAVKRCMAARGWRQD